MYLSNSSISREGHQERETENICVHIRSRNVAVIGVALAASSRAKNLGHDRLQENNENVTKSNLVEEK